MDAIEENDILQFQPTVKKSETFVAVFQDWRSGMTDKEMDLPALSSLISCVEQAMREAAGNLEFEEACAKNQ